LFTGVVFFAEGTPFFSLVVAEIVSLSLKSANVLGATNNRFPLRPLALFAPFPLRTSPSAPTRLRH